MTQGMRNKDMIEEAAREPVRILHAKQMKRNRIASRKAAAMNGKFLNFRRTMPLLG